MTAVLTDPDTRSTRHRVVVRPAPRREPPFDDELAQLSPVGSHDRVLPFATSPRAPLRLVGPTRPPGMPDPAVWGRRLLIGLTECAGGRRPLAQLASSLSLSVARGLRQDLEHVDSRENRGMRWLGRATVRSVLASCPADGVAELAATVEVAGRVRAIALRLEQRRGRWCCTRLHVG